MEKVRFKYKVLFIFVLLILKVSTNFFPHIIWMYWDTGFENIGNFQRACFQLVQKLHKETDWEIRFVDNTTLSSWFGPVQFLELSQFLNPNLEVTKQTRANFVRYFLLRQHGGIWLDLSIILHQNLNWLEKLDTNHYVMNRQVFQTPEIFVFVICDGQRQKGPIYHNGQVLYPRLFMQNSMIATVKKSQFMIDLIEQYKKMIKYSRSQYLEIAQKINSPYGFNPYFRAYMTEAFIVYKRYLNYYTASTQQKKHFQFYKMWAMDRQIGLYHKIEKTTFNFFFQSEYFRGDYGRYMTKINHFGFQQMLQAMFNNSLANIQNMSIFLYNSSYQFGIKYIRQAYSCLYQARIYEDSLLNKHLIQEIEIKDLFPNTIVKKNNQLPILCRYTNLAQLHQILQIVLSWAFYSFKTILVIQVLVQYFIYFINFNIGDEKIKAYKQKYKYRAFIIFGLMHILVFQAHSLRNIIQVLMEGSPCAWKTILVQTILLILVVKKIVNVIILKKRKDKMIIWQLLQLSLFLIIKYWGWYTFALWKYKEAVFRYKIISNLNLRELLQQEKYILKIIVLFSSYYIFMLVKHNFNLYIQKVGEFEQKQQNFQYQNIAVGNQFQNQSRDNTLY